jgi:hypothetical protein
VTKVPTNELLFHTSVGNLTFLKRRPLSRSFRAHDSFGTGFDYGTAVQHCHPCLRRRLGTSGSVSEVFGDTDGSSKFRSHRRRRRKQPNRPAISAICCGSYGKLPARIPSGDQPGSRFKNDIFGNECLRPRLAAHEATFVHCDRLFLP